MAAKQLKCKETGKMKYVSRCMRKNCKNLVMDFSKTERYRLPEIKLIKVIMLRTEFMCMPE